MALQLLQSFISVHLKRFWLAKKHLMLQKWCFVLQVGGNYSTIPTHGAKVIVRGSIGWLP